MEDIKGDLHINRAWVNSPFHRDSGDDRNFFGLVSYNILADCHIRPEWYEYCPREFKGMKDRHRQLLKELAHHSKDTDVVCLQEVGPEYYANLLNKSMCDLGYTGSFFKRIYGTDEGVATFHRKDRFDLIEQRCVSCNQLIDEALDCSNISDAKKETVRKRVHQDDVVIYSKLFDKRTHQTLFVGNVHLAFADYKFVDVTSLQAVAAINGLLRFAGSVDTHHILCGDFNLEPHLPGYKLLQESCLDNAAEEILTKYPIQCSNNTQKPIFLVDIARECFSHNSIHLKSAYKTILGRESEFSNYEDFLGTEWKTSIPESQRSTVKVDGVYLSDTEKYGSEIFKATLDYQWFNSDKLECTGVLQMIEEDTLKPLHACPNEIFPSDHLLMKARYEYRSATGV